MADPAALRAGPAVFFLHLPKTGGVSFQAALAQGLAGSRQLVGLTSTVDLPANFTCLAEFGLVAGHLPWPLRRFLRWPRRTVSLFRDPWERALSAYRHLLRDTAHPDHALLRTEAPSLGAILRHPQLRWHFVSPYTRLLGADEAPVLAARREGARAAGKAARRLGRPQEPDGAMLARALHAVATLDFVATTETLDQDGPRCLAGLLGAPPPPLPHLNAAPQEQQVALTAAEGRALRSALRYDWVVWDAVRRRLRQERQAAGREGAAAVAA